VRSYHRLRRTTAIVLGCLVWSFGGSVFGQAAKPPVPPAPPAAPAAKAAKVSKAPRAETTTPAEKRKPAATDSEAPTTPPKPLLMRYARPATEESLVKVLNFYPKTAPMLEIQSPWKQYTKPSIEVRLLLPDENDTTEIRPLAFVGTVMKGELTNAVYKALEDVQETPFVRSFPTKGGEFHIFGFKNYLEREAIRIVFQPAAVPTAAASDKAKRPATDQPEVPVRTTFYFLNSWAVDSETLRLELPAKDYRQAGRLRVWFFRDAGVIWQQTVQWPGMDAGKDGVQNGPSDAAKAAAK
jgi:hypothetical protein